MTEASQRALSILRSPEHFQWTVIPLLAFVIYVYAVEIGKQNWHVVLTGLLFYLGECCWEMINGLILHFSGYAALWSTPGSSAFVILVGLNIEISMMFAVAGIVLVKLLPEQRDLAILGMPNRWLIPILLGLFCVFIEVLLNRAGALVWDYSFWCWPHVYLIVLVYTAPFLLMAWVYDNVSLRVKVRWLVGLMGITVGMWLIFVIILGWI